MEVLSVDEGDGALDGGLRGHQSPPEKDNPARGLSAYRTGSKFALSIPSGAAPLSRHCFPHPIPHETHLQGKRLSVWRGGGCLALAIDPRFRRCEAGGFGAFLIVKRAARVGRANRHRLFAENGDAELADPPARLFPLHRKRDGVQFIPVFLMPAAVAVKDAVAGFRIDGSPERGRIGHAEQRAATIRDRTWLAQLQHGASIAQEERAAA